MYSPARYVRAINVSVGSVGAPVTSIPPSTMNRFFTSWAWQNELTNPRHVATSPFNSYNYHGKGFFGTFVDVVVLGATEVDVNFNANVVTHSDGRLLHGIGGWQNCLFAECTILAVPAVRDRIPVIVDEVTTLTGPGELIDVIVTERGIAINPLRRDLLDAVRGKDLPMRDIHDIQREVEQICGEKPQRPRRGDKVVAAVKWVDGTVIDSVWQVKH